MSFSPTRDKKSTLKTSRSFILLITTTMIRVTVFLLMLLAFATWAVAIEIIPNEYIIKTVSTLKANTINELDLYFMGKDGDGERKELKRWNDLRMRHVVLDTNALEYVKNKFSNLVEYIEPNQVFHMLPVNDENTNAIPRGQWGLPAINIEKAWKISKGTKEIIVGVVDTGIDCTHDALKGHCLPGWNFVNNTEGGIDDQGHGTHCAGVIAANSVNAMGVAPKVTVLAAKFLGADGGGSLDGAISAIKYAVDKGASILSNSWGGGDFSQALKDVIHYAGEHHVTFVVAAGNESNDNDASPTYPASFDEPNIISVAAIDSKNEMAYFSNFGASSVHLAAPGVNILSTVPGNKTESMSGTSMATPFVSGVSALYLSLHPQASFQEIKNKILNSTKLLPSLKGKVLTGGLLNAYEAIKN